MKRRQFLTIGGSSLGAVLLSQCVSRSGRQPSPHPGALVQSALPGGKPDLEAHLDAIATEIDLGDTRARLLTYNGQIPGPRLEARPGDRVRIHLTNRLDTPTNLHYHGLHIPPTDRADNIFLRVEPGETFTYDFTLPSTHPAGTFYYHPHLHGFVGEQVFGGLGGIFVVRGDLDAIPEIETAQEEFLFLKDFGVSTAGNPAITTGLMAGREGNLITVNGQVQPQISMAAKGLLRLRLVNASNARFYRLALEGHSFHLIATDGGAIEAPVALSELLLSPGERAEVLVQANQEPGSYRLWRLPYNRGGMGMMGGGMGMMGNSSSARLPTEEPIALATFTYTTAVSPTVLPLPQYLRPIEALPTASVQRQFKLNHGMVPGQGMAFLINGRSFAADRLDTAVRLETVEEWEVRNTGVMDHPFHLHTNPVQVISRNGRSEPYLAWKDTVLIQTGETVRFRVKFADYPGRTVYHCHILDHEELGMMGTIEMQT